MSLVNHIACLLPFLPALAIKTNLPNTMSVLNIANQVHCTECDSMTHPTNRCWILLDKIDGVYGLKDSKQTFSQVASKNLEPEFKPSMFKPYEFMKPSESDDGFIEITKKPKKEPKEKEENVFSDICLSCNQKFIIDEDTLNTYAFRGWKLPRNCKPCIQDRYMNRWPM